MAGLALAELGGLAGRGARFSASVDGGEILVIDESYNANPASMRAALAVLAAEPAARSIAGCHSAISRRSSACVRSEEHTSELQSLMRISYAVFCLKTKKKKK